MMRPAKKILLAQATLFALGAMTAAHAETISPSSNPLEIRSADGANRVRLLGRLFYDVGNIDADVAKMQASDQVDSARLGLGGTVAHDFDFLLQYEMAKAFRGDSPAAVLKDAWLGYSGLKSWDFRVGQMLEPFSLEELTSSRYTTFMERALPNALVPEYHLGVETSYHGKGWQATGGYFGRSIGPGSNDYGWGYAARVTADPIRSKGNLLHLGMSAAYRDPGDGTVRFRARPETGLTDVRLVNTTTLHDVADYTTEGAEAAVVKGPFSLQAEYMLNQVNRGNGRADASFHGSYVYASWFLTGESRSYSEKRGVFVGIKPQHGYGAVELAARYSTLDLNDAPVAGGVEHDWTLGLNWYATPSLRLMTNAVWVNSTRRGVEDNLRILQARLQYAF